MDSMESRPTLVIDGGGLKMSYAAGFVTGLFNYDGIKITYFRDVFATSAGACIAAYYATEQVKEGERIFKERLPRKFIRWYGTDMPYLEKVLRELEPLNVKALAACPTKIYITLTNVDTDEQEIMCLNDAPDPVAVLLAGVSWKQPYKINNHLYVDGGFKGQIPLRFAIAAKAQKIWVLSGDIHEYRMSQFVRTLALLFPHSPKMMRLWLQVPDNQNKVLEQVEKHSDLVAIRPESSLSIGLGDSSRKKVSAAFELGKNDAKKFILENNLS
jgi:predicted patatin/cPLA2 family phospholipase